MFLVYLYPCAPVTKIGFRQRYFHIQPCVCNKRISCVAAPGGRFTLPVSSTGCWGYSHAPPLLTHVKQSEYFHKLIIEKKSLPYLNLWLHSSAYWIKVQTNDNLELS